MYDLFRYDRRKVHPGAVRDAYTLYKQTICDKSPLRGFSRFKSFKQQYRGTWDTFLEFATHKFNVWHLEMIPEEVMFYVDYQAFALDLAYQYHCIPTGNGRVHIFGAA